MLVVSSLLAPACGSDPLAPDPNAALWETCAPNDARAITLLVSDRPVTLPPAGPFVSITVYRSIADVEGKQFAVGAESFETGAAAVCRSSQDCDAAHATVRFGRLDEDETMVVAYSVLTTPDLMVRPSILFRVRARLLPDRMLCG